MPSRRYAEKDVVHTDLWTSCDSLTRQPQSSRKELTELISFLTSMNQFHTISDFTINLCLWQPILSGASVQQYGTLWVQSGPLLFETP